MATTTTTAICETCGPTRHLAPRHCLQGMRHLWCQMTAYLQRGAGCGTTAEPPDHLTPSTFVPLVELNPPEWQTLTQQCGCCFAFISGQCHRRLLGFAADFCLQAGSRMVDNNHFLYSYFSQQTAVAWQPWLLSCSLNRLLFLIQTQEHFPSFFTLGYN